MEQELYYEWCLFEKRSLELINNLTIRKIDKFRLLKIIEVPSLYWDCVKRWELYEDMVVRIDWFCQDDYKKFTNETERARHPKEIIPTIKYRLREIEKGYSDSVIKCLSNISIPIIAKKEYGVCDGVGYELVINNLGSTIEFSFSQDAPEAWKDVWDITKRLMGEFDNIVKDEEYNDSICANGELWLEPTSNIKITRELLNFFKQFAGLSNYNVIKISEMIKSEKPVLLESNYDYFRYRRIQSEFIKYGLKVDFIT